MLARALRIFVPDLKETFYRFPLSVFCAITASIVTQLAFSFGDTQSLARIIFIGICGCFWTIAAKLFAEQRNWSLSKSHLFATFIFLLVALRLSTAAQTWVAFALLTGAGFLAMFIAPFVTGRKDDEAVWPFGYRLAQQIILAFAAALALYLGCLAIYSSFVFLFGVDLAGDIAFRFWCIVALLFAPLLAMSGIPENFSAAVTPLSKNLRILILYIAAPVTLVYAAILYAYAVKIALAGSLPQGTVAYLVSGFGCVGTAVYIALYPFYDDGKSFASWYGRHFFKLLPIPLVLLAIAIGTRIHRYGVTEERYSVALCLVWLIACSAYVSLRRINALKFILFSLSALLIAASFGPWGAIGLSSWSQTARLETILARNGLLENNRLVPAKAPLPRAEQFAISAIVDYLVDTKKEVRIAGWPIKSAAVDERVAVMKAMNLNFINDYGRLERWRNGETTRNDNFTLNFTAPATLNGINSNRATDVRGYDYVIENVSVSSPDSLQPPIRQNHSLSSNPYTVKFTFGNAAPPLMLHVTYDEATGDYRIANPATAEFVSLAVGPAVTGLIKPDQDPYQVATEQPVITGESANLSIKLTMQSIAGRFYGEKPVITNIQGQLLIKLKTAPGPQSAAPASP